MFTTLAVSTAVLLAGGAYDPAPTIQQVSDAEKILKRGQEGPAVSTVQEYLNGIGVKAPTNGKFDAKTGAAVRHFQDKYGYVPTGHINHSGLFRLSKLYGNGQLPKICRTSDRIICIDKTQKTLRSMADGEEKVVTDVRFGSEATPTRNGKFRVFSKIRYLISQLAGTPMPYSLFFSGGQAVHYSPGFHRDGYNGASLGCVNVRKFKDARRIYVSNPVGTPVYIYRS